MKTKYVLIPEKYRNQLATELLPWIKEQKFVYHGGEIMAEQILTEYLANKRGFTIFPEKASYE